MNGMDDGEAVGSGGRFYKHTLYDSISREQFIQGRKWLFRNIDVSGANHTEEPGRMGCPSVYMENHRDVEDGDIHFFRFTDWVYIRV